MYTNQMENAKKELHELRDVEKALRLEKDKANARARQLDTKAAQLKNELAVAKVMQRLFCYAIPEVYCRVRYSRSRQKSALFRRLLVPTLKQ